MLTAATLGMAGYGVYSIAMALIDLVSRSQGEAWADLAQVFFGLLLLLGSAFVRVMMPGGIALALGAMLGLQALAVHAESHSPVGLTLLPQVLRGAFALLLVALAYFGSRAPGRATEESSVQDRVQK